MKSGSPIEEDFLTALKSILGARLKVLERPSVEGLRNIALADEDRAFVCVGQQVPVGLYRADFIVTAHRPPLWFTTLCVECDGKDFHTSKQQRQRDRARDSFFRSRDIDVMRFSGKAMMRDPYKCAYAAIEVVTQGLITRGNEGLRTLAGIAHGELRT